MAVTIRQLMELEIMRRFTVMAGKTQLDRSIRGTGILDFELSGELESYRARAAKRDGEPAEGAEREGRPPDSFAFDKDSLVLSSLLFTKGDPESLYEAVQRLIELDVACLAYKPVIFERLPGEVVRLAEQNSFCILRFGGDEWFEDVIYAIASEIEREDRGGKLEELMRRLLSGTMSQDQILRALDFINPSCCDYLLAVNLIDAGEGRNGGKTAGRLAQRVLSKRLHGKCSLCRYENSLFILLFGEAEQKQRYMDLLQDVLYELGVRAEDCIRGIGSVCPASGLDRAVTEAHYARMAAEMEGQSSMEYAHIGMYRMILASRDREGLHKYMAEYLAPVYGKGDSNSRELFRTAVSYILSKGDLSLTAEALCCHRNTIRYRIAKLQEKLCGEEPSKDFYTELSLAVKIYLTETYREREELFER